MDMTISNSVYLTVFVPSGTGTKEHKSQHFQWSAKFCPVLLWLFVAECVLSVFSLSAAPRIPAHTSGLFAAAAPRQAAPSTWFAFGARLHMMSHFHCQPGQGQDSSSWEGLH